MGKGKKTENALVFLGVRTVWVTEGVVLSRAGPIIGSNRLNTWIMNLIFEKKKLITVILEIVLNPIVYCSAYQIC